MQILINKVGKKSGYLHNNVILLPGHVVGGVMLGHCVFTRKGNVKGQFFKEHLYNERGEIVARLQKNESFEIITEMKQQIMIDAWEVLLRAKNHTCSWVITTEKWSPMSLEDFLAQ